MKRRYSMPAKIVELLWKDDEYYREVTKIKKVSSTSNFPKTDQRVDEEGFKIEFALAGYSPSDVLIKVSGKVLSVSSGGMDDEYSQPTPKEDDDAFEEYVKDAKAKTQRGFVVRGIARRSFNVKLLISEDFDLSRVNAIMEHGLLQITIPNTIPEKETYIEIGTRK